MRGYPLARYLLTLLVAALALALATPGQARVGDTLRVSVDNAGAQVADLSDNPTISADGRYVAFESDSASLVAGDTNNARDIFVRDTLEGTTRLVSLADNGDQLGTGALGASLSANGRYLAFYTFAPLGYYDGNARADVVLRDLVDNRNWIVSVSTGGQLGNNHSVYPAVSADGEHVCYRSIATNLVTGDTNGVGDIFIRDVWGFVTYRASVATGGGQANGDSYRCALSAGWRWIAFESDATNLVSNDFNNKQDIFVHDRLTGETSRVSVMTGGYEVNNHSYNPVISADGRYVAFESDASNLVGNDTNNTRDIFVHDRQTGQTTRVSVASDGSEGLGFGAYDASISADGRFVAFGSNFTNLTPADQNGGLSDVFVHDRLTRTTTLVSQSSSGVQAQGGDSSRPVLSADGRFIAFPSAATNLVDGDTNNAWDVFRREVRAWLVYLPSLQR